MQALLIANSVGSSVARGTRDRVTRVYMRLFLSYDAGKCGTQFTNEIPYKLKSVWLHKGKICFQQTYY